MMGFLKKFLAFVEQKVEAFSKNDLESLPYTIRIIQFYGRAQIKVRNSPAV